MPDPSALSLVSSKEDTSSLTVVVGRFENIHCSRMLWCFRHHGLDCSEYKRSPGRLSDSAWIFRASGVCFAPAHRLVVNDLPKLDSVLEDIEFSAIKTGMLYGSDHVRAVVRSLKRHYTDKGKPIPPLVVDPVCVSTSGHRLLSEEAVSVMLEELFPLAVLTTPNVPEAEMIISSSGRDEARQIKTFDSAVQASMSIPTPMSCPTNVLLKGGHLDVRRSQLPHDVALEDSLEILSLERQPGNDELNDEKIVPDTFFDHSTQKFQIMFHPRIQSMSTHGTGCTLSAAIACFLAQGHSRRFLRILYAPRHYDDALLQYMIPLHRPESTHTVVSSWPFPSVAVTALSTTCML